MRLVETLFPILLLTVCLVGRAGAVKIYINPSDQTRNLSPDGTYNEAAAMKDMAQRLEAKLSARGFEVRNSDGGTMREACTAANAWPADIFISLHTNARRGTGWGEPHGTTTLHYQPREGEINPVSEELSDRCLVKCVEKFTTYGRGHDRRSVADLPYLGHNLYVLRKTEMPGTLVEGLFHDNEADTAVLKTEEGRDAYAQGVYEAICDHFGWSYYPDAPILDPVGPVANDSNGWLAVVSRSDKGNAMCIRQTGINTAWPRERLDLEGTLSGGAATGRNAQGRLQAFFRGPGDRIWHKVQASARVARWNGWYDLGGNASADPAIGRSADGRLLVFAVASDGRLRYRVQRRLHSALAWDGWYDLGGGFEGRPAVYPDADGRLVVVCRTRDNGLMWMVQAGARGWDKWQDIDGVVAGDPYVVRDGSGRLAVFSLGPDGHVLCRTRKGSTWDAWQDLGGSFDGGPAVAVSTDGRLEVFAIDAQGAVSHNGQESGEKWSGWQTLGGSFIGHTMVGRNLDGRIELFARTRHGQVQYRVQREPAKSAIWDGWYTLGEAAETE